MFRLLYSHWPQENEIQVRGYCGNEFGNCDFDLMSRLKRVMQTEGVE